VITLSGAAEGRASGGMRPGVQALEAPQHTLFRHLKNKFFSRNLSQNMSKNTYFLKKDCKIAAALWRAIPNPHWPPAVGVSAPKPLRYYSHLLI